MRTAPRPPTPGTATDARTGRERRRTLLWGCGRDAGASRNPADAVRPSCADTSEWLRSSSEADLPEPSFRCWAGKSDERGFRRRCFARERPSAIASRRHHGRSLSVPSSARRKTLHFDPSCIRFDDGIGVRILHSLLPSTQQLGGGKCRDASPGAVPARYRTPVYAPRANSGFRRGTVPRDGSARRCRWNRPCSMPSSERRMRPARFHDPPGLDADRVP